MMRLNGFTNGFAGQRSTFGDISPRWVEWVYYQNPFDGVSIFEDGWMYAPEVPDIQSRHKIGWLMEPRALHPENYERILTVADRFDFILTYDASLLEDRPDKFKLCPCMGVSVAREHWGLWPKSKNVAMIVTHKNATPGHKLRREIESNFRLIDFFGREAWADKATVLKDYRFVVAIESERTDNFFTGHLLDALALGCVPIYWGAPNIGNYLDEASILAWSEKDELANIIRTVSQEGERMYLAYLPSLKRNLERLPEYALVEDWFYEHHLRELP